MLKRTLSIFFIILALMPVVALNVFATNVSSSTATTKATVKEETYTYTKTLLPLTERKNNYYDVRDEYKITVPVNSTVIFDFTKTERESSYTLAIIDTKTNTSVYSSFVTDRYGIYTTEKTYVDLKAGTYTVKVGSGDLGLGISNYKLQITCKRVYTTSNPYYFLTSEAQNGKIYKDSPVTYKLNVLPKSAKLPKATWTSSNTDVATISSTGKITVKKSGKFTVTAKFDKKTLKATVSAVVPQYSTLKNFTMYQGNTEKLQITIKPSDYPVNSIKWTSSKPAVATVDSKGKVTAKTPGTTVITATINGKKISCTLTVKKTQLNTTKQTVNATESYQLEVLGGTGKTTWTSSNKNIATVSATGKVTGKKAGKCVVSATKNGKTFKCVITVQWPAETGVVKTVKIDTAGSEHGKFYEFTLKGKSTVTIIAKAKSDIDSLYLSFYNDSYSTWSKFLYKEDGTFMKKETLEAGDYRLYYSTDADAYLSVKTVTKPQIYSTTDSNCLGKGYTLKLGATGYKVAGTWSTSDSKIATVSSKGVVTGKKLGSCKIYYTLKDGTKLSYTVKVLNPVTLNVTHVYNTSIYNECDIQITNYTNKTIQYVEFNLKQYDYRGARVSSPYSYYYCDYEIKPKETRGFSDFWVNDHAKTVKPYIIKVKFTDGSTWRP